MRWSLTAWTRSSWLRKRLEDDSPDPVREMAKAFAERLMSAEADALCGAGYGERSPERVNSRNGYRRRELDTRARHHGPGGPQAERGQLLPELAPRARAGGPKGRSPRWSASAT